MCQHTGQQQHRDRNTQSASLGIAHDHRIMFAIRIDRSAIGRNAGTRVSAHAHSRKRSTEHNVLRKESLHLIRHLKAIQVIIPAINSYYTTCEPSKCRACPHEHANRTQTPQRGNKLALGSRRAGPGNRVQVGQVLARSLMRAWHAECDAASVSARARAPAKDNMSASMAHFTALESCTRIAGE